jgi:hypothetical protein
MTTKTTLPNDPAPVAPARIEVLEAVVDQLLRRMDVTQAILRAELGIEWTHTRDAEEPGQCPPVSYADPVSARIQARKRRLEASGLRLVQGGAR